ncbi:ATP-binding protein [Nonomuraea longicatena]|uniref:Histidine kinase/HSP90-like ATPase domain-containing protein n=1 Tax=Nonomuraea longicatena TaxID=83682 RepID=A0ABP4BTC3_9ACTN
MSNVSGLADRQVSSWCDLPSSPVAPSVARRWVTAMCASWRLRLSPADKATIIELTSELVTNAVQHAVPAARGVPEIRINVRAGFAVFWLAVCDPDPALPQVRIPDFLAESGRGMYLVEAQADRWGAVRHGAGKYVWFSLECQGDAAHASEPRTVRSFTDTMKENAPCLPSPFPTTFAVPGHTV